MKFIMNKCVFIGEKNDILFLRGNITYYICKSSFAKLNVRCMKITKSNAVQLLHIEF